MDTSGFDNIVFETGGQTKQASSKNRVDIVFVIDNSGSMSSVIEGVKNHINSFVTSLEQNANNSIDFKIGFVMHGNEAILVKDFTSNVSDFEQAMQSTKNHNTGYNEFGLPAIDVASDFAWEPKRHKFIIIFTDESTNGGHDASYQLSKFPQLLSKLEALKIKLYYLGVDSPDYQEFKKVPGTHYDPNESYENVDFSELLSRIGKSVSQASGSNLQTTEQSVEKDIYNVQSYVKLIKL